MLRDEVVQSTPLRSLQRVWDLSRWMANVQGENYRTRMISGEHLVHSQEVWANSEPEMLSWWEEALEVIMTKVWRLDLVQGRLKRSKMCIPDYSPEGVFLVSAAFLRYL